MSSHNHQFSPDLRATIRKCALIAKRVTDMRERHNIQAGQIRHVLDSGTTLLQRVDYLDYCLSQLPTTRPYSGLAEQYNASMIHLSEELNSTLATLNDIYTVFVKETKGHNIQLLVHLLCYTGDDKAAAETLLSISEKHELSNGTGNRCLRSWMNS